MTVDDSDRSRVGDGYDRSVADEDAQREKEPGQSGSSGQSSAGFGDASRASEYDRNFEGENATGVGAAEVDEKEQGAGEQQGGADIVIGSSSVWSERPDIGSVQTQENKAETGKTIMQMGDASLEGVDNDSEMGGQKQESDDTNTVSAIKLSDDIQDSDRLGDETDISSGKDIKVDETETRPSRKESGDGETLEENVKDEESREADAASTAEGVDGGQAPVEARVDGENDDAAAETGPVRCVLLCVEIGLFMSNERRVLPHPRDIVRGFDAHPPLPTTTPLPHYFRSALWRVR